MMIKKTAIGFALLSVVLLWVVFYNDSPEASVQTLSEEKTSMAADGLPASAHSIPPAASIPELTGENPAIILPGHTHIHMDQIDPGLVLSKKTERLENGETRRLFLINGGGKYPLHRIEELVRYDSERGVHVVVRQLIEVADHVMVKLREGKTAADLDRLHARYNTRVLRDLGFGNHYLIQLPEPSFDGVAEAAAYFAEHSEIVERAAANSINQPTAVPNDTLWNVQWGKVRMDCPEAWDKETGSTNVIVAIIDTGVDLDHSDLAAHVWKNPGEAGPLATNGVDDDANGYIDDWTGWDFAQEDNDPDDNGDNDVTTNETFSSGSHGTHCAGIVGGIGNNSNVVAGVCWEVSIMATKAAGYLYDPYYRMMFYSSDAIAAMYYATDNGAKLTSNSYGGPGGGAAYYSGVDYQNDHGVLFIAAAGNDGVDNDATAYQPAGINLPNVIAVASSTSSEVLASTSNYGDTTVDIVAPGSSIMSTTPNNLSGYKSGTSMAAPQVAGAAALLFSYSPTLEYLDCKQALLDGVDTFSAYTDKCVSDGRMNVSRSLDILDGYLLTAPSGGEVWPYLSTNAIRWATGNTNGFLKIELYHNATNMMTIASNVNRGARTYDWTVPDTLPADTNYSIRIESLTNASEFAQSGLFSIQALFPYSESFESVFGRWENVGGDDFDWTRQSGSTPSSSTGPSGAADGTYYLFIESSSPNNPAKTAVIEADFPFDELSNPEISFSYHMYGSGMGTLYLDASTNSGSSWNTEWSLSGDQGDVWVETHVSLSAYAGKAVTLRFRGLTDGYTSDIAIDAIAIGDVIAQLETDLTELNIPEGSTNVFRVRLDADPFDPVTVSVSRVSGDTNISVQSESNLIFNTGTWSIWQLVTLAAEEDADWTNASAVIRCSASGRTSLDVTASEADNDTDPVYLLPFVETFENNATNAGALGDLDGQHGWVSTGTAEVQNSTVYAGSQALRLQNGSAAHAFSNAVTNVTISLLARPRFAEIPGPIPANAVAVFYINTNGNVVAYSNTTAITLGTTVTADTWVRFEISCDYTTDTWSLQVDGSPALSDFPFHSAQSGLKELAFMEGSSDSYSYIDNIDVAETTGGEPDEDDDGLPDWWETQYYGGSTNANPAATVANGVNTTEEAYIAGLDPTDPDARFVMTKLGGDNGNTDHYVMQWTATSGRVYTIWWSPSLTNTFTPMQSNYTGGAFTDSTHSVEDKGFYKIEVQLEE